MEIRLIEENDALELALFFKKLAQETDFLMFKPHETFSKEIWETKIQSGKKTNNPFMSIVLHKNQIVGFISLTKGGYQKNQFSASLVLGLLSNYRAKGLGAKLMNIAEKHALSQNLKRLELTVMTHNQPAIHLYKKCGFVIEGTKRFSLFVDHKFVDEYLMAKYL